MARRAWLFPVVALWALALSCPVALGANVTVKTTSSNAFESNSVAITQGDTVTWENLSGSHNVHFEEFSYVMPPDPFATNSWTVYNTFTEPGTYHYYCEVHGGPGGMGMSGTVVVNPPPAGGGGGTPGPGPAPVDTAPVASLISASKQRVDKLFVRASMNEVGTLTAAGTVAVPAGAAKLYRFKSVSKAVSANVPVKLPLKLSKKSLKVVKAALRRRKKLSAKVTLTAKDTTGHRTIRKQTIRLSR